MHFKAICSLPPCNRKELTKTLLIMKFTAILLLAASLQVSAIGFSQGITLSENNVSLEKIFKEIRKQSGYNFVYTQQLLQNSKKVSIQVENTTLEKALDECFKGQVITYTILNNTIVVKPKPTPALESDDLSNPLPPIDIHGQVTDSVGNPLVGASVIVKGSGKGTSTDANGNFELKGVKDNAILVISFSGYSNRDYKVNGQILANITLVRSTSPMDEVVVIGYGTEKKSNLTGAVAQVSGKVLENRAVTNIGLGLQGLIGNLNISTVSDPGGVGTPSTFNIRGVTSLNGGGPLFVVDGVPANSIDNINPNDIESITVLKDAASSAVYGARAAYGVMLITTKRGKKGDKVSVTYNIMSSWNKPTVLPKKANSLESVETFNAAAANSGLPAPFGTDQIGRIKQYMTNPSSVPVTTPDPNDPNRWSWDNANANTDWVKEYIKPSFSQKHDLAVSGGSKSTSYYTSFGFLDQGGILRYGDDKFSRYNVTSNLHTEPTNWMRVDLRMRFAKSITDYPFPYSDLIGNWFHALVAMRPYWPLHNPDGQLSQISALPYQNSGGRSILNSNDLWLTGAVELEPVKNWKINMDYTWNQLSSKSSDQDALVYANAVDGTKYSIGHGQSAISESAAMNQYNSLNVYTSYERQMGRHFVKALIGQQLEVSQFFTLTGSRTNLITDLIPSMGVATGTQNAADAISHWATTGTFARLNYNFNEKFLVEFNGRYDGTSKFPVSNRFGFFPSVSAGYNIAKEKFWPLKGQVSQFKIRSSYGSLGNQAVANYLYLSTIPIGSNLGYILNNVRPNYLSTPGLNSSDLTWETARTTDLGLDVTLLKNRLDVSFDVYNRTTLNMLGPAEAIPAVLGAAVPLMNNANLETKGFELSISWKDRIGTEFSYHASFVLSDYVGKVTKYNNPTGTLATYYKGMTIGEIWGWRSKGLIQTDQQLQSMPDQSLFWGGPYYKGDVLYEDLNKDGKVDFGNYTLKNSGDYKVIGNSTPRYTFGLNAGFNWKGFDFNMFWQGVGKRESWLGGTIFYGLLGAYGSSIMKNTLDYWTPENTKAYWPRPYATDEVNKNRVTSTRYLQNTAYTRLKNLQFGYTLPQQLLPHIKIQRLRVFVSGENLLTFSKVNGNFDPEVIDGSWGSGKEYPLMKTITFGLNVEF